MGHIQNVAARTGSTVLLKGMRKMIAAKMSESLQTAAQLTHHAECELTNLQAKRAQLKAAGSQVSLQDLLLFEIVCSLKNHPGLNATLQDNQITRHGSVHLGLAIPLPDDLLVAPALFDADQLDAQGLALARRALVDKALSGKLSVKELTGATVTVTNLGLSRVRFFTPILNVPQVAIIGLGGIQRRLQRGADGSLSERDFMGLSLTFDHRAVNGAPAADFLDDLCQRIEGVEPP